MSLMYKCYFKPLIGSYTIKRFPNVVHSDTSFLKRYKSTSIPDKRAEARGESEQLPCPALSQGRAAVSAHTPGVTPLGTCAM